VSGPEHCSSAVTSPATVTKGVAYFFSARCGPRPYNVNGPVQENGGRVTMAGAGTVINDRCQLVGTINDTLVFDFLYKE
jgi:hypothetical protein